MRIGRSMIAGICVAAGVLSGCDERITYRTSLEASTQSTRIERDALDATVTAFFGDRISEEDRDEILGGDDGIEAARFERRQSTVAGVRVRGQYPLSGRWSAIGGIALSKGVGRYDLPEGVNALTDKARVDFSTVALNGSVGLAYVLPHTNRLSTEITAGIGHLKAHTRTKISSALLDVRENSTSGRSYAFVGTRLIYSPNPGAGSGEQFYLEGQARRFESEGYDAQLAFGIEFQN